MALSSISRNTERKTIQKKGPVPYQRTKKGGGVPLFLDIEDTKQKVGLINQAPTEEKP